jgi:endoglucanase
MKRIAAIALLCGGQAILSAQSFEHDTLYLAARAFYGQRCGTAVDMGGGYKHSACHLRGAWHPSSGRAGVREATGGWHDAGDYGRYVVNSGITTGTLMWAWELFPESFVSLSLDIPESNNKIPDLLDEVAWNLRWMYSMQDADGGVWHKQTSAAFPALALMPEDDRTVSLVIGTGRAPYKSSCATANVAAVAAIAARVYRPFDTAFADQSTVVADKAWRWVSTNPNVTFKNPAGVTTGEYGDEDCRDEMLWASAELWRSLDRADARAYFLANVDEANGAIRSDDPVSWSEVGAMAAWTHLLGSRPDSSPSLPLRSEQATSRLLMTRTIAAADAIVARASKHPYRVPMNDRDYVWGSNAVALNYGLQLLVANELAPDPRYVAAARDISRYILGNNALGISFVTGTGERSPQHPHHRPSAGDRIAAPWPGLLAGGPNRHNQDPVLRKLPKELSPAQRYADDVESFASNEVAINWNASLVFVLAGIRSGEQ